MIGQGAGAVSFAQEFFNPITPVSVPVHGFLPGQRLRVVLIPTGSDRFTEHAVVRNSTLNGHWQNEERWEQEFPFHAGRIYTLEFFAHPGRVSVTINGHPYCEFNERHNHASVNLIEVEGSVHVHSIHVTN